MRLRKEEKTFNNGAVLSSSPRGKAFADGAKRLQVAIIRRGLIHAWFRN